MWSSVTVAIGCPLPIRLRRLLVLLGLLDGVARRRPRLPAPRHVADVGEAVPLEGARPEAGAEDPLSQYTATGLSLSSRSSFFSSSGRKMYAPPLRRGLPPTPKASATSSILFQKGVGCV